MKTMKIFLAFVLMLIIGFFTVGFTSSVTPPTAATEAGYQYANLTTAVSISSAGLYAVMLILILGMVFSAMVLLMSSLKRRSA